MASLNVPPPLSPPILTQISSSGILPSCQLNLPHLKSTQILTSHYQVKCLFYLSFCSSSCSIFDQISGIYPYGRSLTTSQLSLSFRGNVRATFSTTGPLSPINSAALFLILPSLAMLTLHSVNHLLARPLLLLRLLLPLCTGLTCGWL